MMDIVDRHHDRQQSAGVEGWGEVMPAKTPLITGKHQLLLAMVTAIVASFGTMV